MARRLSLVTGNLVIVLRPAYWTFVQSSGDRRSCRRDPCGTGPLAREAGGTAGGDAEASSVRVRRCGHSHRGQRGAGQAKYLPVLEGEAARRLDGRDTRTLLPRQRARAVERDRARRLVLPGGADHPRQLRLAPTMSARAIRTTSGPSRPRWTRERADPAPAPVGQQQKRRAPPRSWARSRRPSTTRSAAGGNSNIERPTVTITASSVWGILAPSGIGCLDEVQGPIGRLDGGD